jgi:hypothetical protein
MCLFVATGIPVWSLGEVTFRGSCPTRVARDTVNLCGVVLAANEEVV